MPDFTPGPWAIGCEGLDIFSMTGDCSIATLDEANSDEEKQANTRLIAAAPDMYDLLVNLYGMIHIPAVKALLARIDGTEDKS